jgi:hypothetical protein
VTRWPVIGLVLALLVGGVAYDRIEQVEPAVPPPPFEAAVNPIMLDPARLSSVWYCPVGSADGGYAEHTVEVVNVSDEPAVATISVLTEAGPGPSIRLDVGPGTRRALPLAEIDQAAAAGAVVEVVGGEGVVDHVVETPHGQARGACATGAADEWHFAGGATTRDATFMLALLNPFPEDAVFDLRFVTTGRARTPSAYQGAIVPARSVRVIEVHAPEVVAREAAVATTITLRRGRVVAERLQTFDGALGPVGAALQLGAPGPALETWFPAGRVHEGGDQRLVVYNPSGAVAELDVSLLPFDPQVSAAFGLVPLEVSVAPGRFEVLDLAETVAQIGLPTPFEVGIHVVSVNGTPVVAERWTLTPPIDTEAIGAGGTELSDADREGEEPPGEEAPAEEAPAADDGAGAEQEAAAGVLPVILSARAQAEEAPVTEEPVTEEPGEEAPAEEAPAEEVPEPLFEEVDELVLPQATPGRGVIIDSGIVAPSIRWYFPGTPVLADDGTALAVLGVAEPATVEVHAIIGGERSEPLLRAEVLPGQRLLLPLSADVPLADLVVEASARVAVAVSLVDADGVAAVHNGIPVLLREGS